MASALAVRSCEDVVLRRERRWGGWSPVALRAARKSSTTSAWAFEPLEWTIFPAEKQTIQLIRGKLRIPSLGPELTNQRNQSLPAFAFPSRSLCRNQKVGFGRQDFAQVALKCQFLRSSADHSGRDTGITDLAGSMEGGCRSAIMLEPTNRLSNY